jgi:glycosyltransferase involved in cell wall biosynthesis
VTEPKSLPRVVALLPAWRAAAFIQETLDSLAAQTYPNLHILISDDASPDNTAELCDAFAAQHQNTRVIRQPKNLGWIGNVNVLLHEASGDFFFFAFHDDLVKPAYVERLVEAFEDNPQAVVAFSDMETHHLDGRIETQKYASLEDIKRGYARAHCIIGADGHWWVPNRGLFRASVAREIGGMKGHLGGDFAVDWLWLLRLALIGEFVRVPEVLVIKRYMKQSVSVLWRHNNPWNHFALGLACLLTLRNAGLPLGEELRLQLRAVRFAGAKLNHFAQHIGRKLLRPYFAIGIMLGIKSPLE